MEKGGRRNRTPRSSWLQKKYRQLKIIIKTNTHGGKMLLITHSILRIFPIRNSQIVVKKKEMSSSRTAHEGENINGIGRQRSACSHPIALANNLGRRNLKNSRKF